MLHKYLKKGNTIVPYKTLPLNLHGACIFNGGIYNEIEKGYVCNTPAILRRIELIHMHGEKAINGAVGNKSDRPKSVPLITKSTKGFDYNPDQMGIISKLTSVSNNLLINDSTLASLSIIVNAFPGTGKTTTMTALLETLAIAFPDLAILVSSHTNNSVNELVSRMTKHYDNVNSSTLAKIAYSAVSKKMGSAWKRSFSKEDSFKSLSEMFERESNLKRDPNENKIYYVMLYNNIQVKKSKKGNLYVDGMYYKLYKKIIELYQGYNLGFDGVKVTYPFQEAYSIVMTHKDAIFKGFKIFSSDEETDEDLSEMFGELSSNSNDIDYNAIVEESLKILRLTDQFHRTVYKHYKPHPKTGVVSPWILFSVSEYCRAALINNWIETDYKFILFDEYQDCNMAQHQFVEKMLAVSGAGSVFIGNFEQTIFNYSGANSAWGMRKLWDNPNFSRFALTYNNRSSINVIYDFVPVHNLKLHEDVKCTKSTTLIKYESKLEFENVLDVAQNGDAILVQYNIDVFKIVLSLMERGKLVHIKNGKFFSNFKDIIDAIKISQQRKVKDVREYFIKKLDALVPTDKNYDKDVIKYTTFLKMIAQFVNAFSLREEDSLTKLSQYIDSKLVDSEEKGITVATIHTTKGCEYNNVFIANINNFNVTCEIPTIAFDEKCKKFVALSRAKVLNYFFEFDGEIKLQTMLDSLDGVTDNIKLKAA